jgi:hypothetical protein
MDNRGKFNTRFDDIARDPELHKATNIVVIAEVDGRPQLWATSDHREAQALTQQAVDLQTA